LYRFELRHPGIRSGAPALLTRGSEPAGGVDPSLSSVASTLTASLSTASAVAEPDPEPSLQAERPMIVATESPLKQNDKQFCLIMVPLIAARAT
jgi:hypothetical protein